MDQNSVNKLERRLQKIEEALIPDFEMVKGALIIEAFKAVGVYREGYFDPEEFYKVHFPKSSDPVGRTALEMSKSELLGKVLSDTEHEL